MSTASRKNPVAGYRSSLNGIGVLLFVLSACTPDTEPTSVERPKAGRPSFTISDGSGFYFLPPLVPSRTFTGQFDPNLAPEVRIVCTGAVGPRCPTLRTMAAGVVIRSEKYTATWKPTKTERNVEPGPNKYRLEVYIGQQRLGFADLWFVARNKDLATVGNAYVGAVVNQSLTINFRIESGIFPENHFPVALDDEFETDQGTSLNGNVLGNDYDPDAGTVLSAVLVTGPSNGTLTLNADGSFQYTPSAGFNGSDSFTYRASDGALTSSVATVAITVNSINTRPFFKRQVAGFQHTCALNASGQAYCWGDNNYAELGNGTSGVVGSSSPVAVTGGHTFVRLAATCGLTAEGAAYCWGSNTLGQLGDGTIGGLSSIPVAVIGDHTFVDLTAGANHTCGLTSAGAAYCWGGNTYGQLGSSASNYAVAPVPVDGGRTFTQIEAGANHTCALEASGAAYCWGGGGLVGDGSFDHQFAPVAVSGGHLFTTIAAGAGHTCGLTTSGAAYCWGSNSYGQIGDGTTDMARTPVAVTGGLTLRRIAPAYEHSCGVTTGGATYCWGRNESGQLGTGSVSSPQTSPVAAASGHTFVELVGGTSHTCARKDTGLIFCWGSGAQGQLGNGLTETSLVPVQTMPF